MCNEKTDVSTRGVKFERFSIQATARENIIHKYFIEIARSDVCVRVFGGVLLCFLYACLYDPVSLVPNFSVAFSNTLTCLIYTTYFQCAILPSNELRIFNKILCKKAFVFLCISAASKTT